jgi:hypothetical protein
MLRVFISLVLVGVVLAAIGVAQGCGDSGDAETRSEPSTQANNRPPVPRDVSSYKEPTRAYREILERLEDAVLAGATYNAAHHARKLGPVERSVTGWLCETAWQMVVNKELFRLPDAKYLADRLSVRAILEVSGSEYSDEGRAPYVAPVAVAVDELQRIIDLRSFDAETDRRYKRTCYGG